MAKSLQVYTIISIEYFLEYLDQWVCTLCKHFNRIPNIHLQSGEVQKS